MLYQANWSHGLEGWQASGGWHLTNEGELQSDASQTNTFTVPYRPAVNNYAVEFRLQVVKVPEDGGFYTLAADPMPGRPGYNANVFNLLTPDHNTSGLHPQLNLLLDPLDAMDTTAAQVHDYEPGSDWRTYRVEIYKWHASLLINDTRNNQAVSTNTDYLSNGPIHFSCGKVVLRISNLRILAL